MSGTSSVHSATSEVPASARTFADVPGARLRYVDTGGGGTPMVFLHANTGTSLSWLPQLRFFAAHGYRAIAFDRRGWGASTAVDPNNGEQASVSEDLDALVRLLGLGSFHLVSAAGGAFAAIDYAAWRPAYLRSLVVAASVGAFDEPEIREFATRIRIPFLSPPAPQALHELSAGYRGSDPDGSQRWADLAAGARQLGAPAQRMRTPNTYKKLGAITCPVLAIAGGADLIAPPAMMRLWARRLPNARLEIIAEAGHSVAWEQPERFNDLLLPFVSAH
jgi:pimeloyl-ACP methyl ester carboxylesterase